MTITPPFMKEVFCGRGEKKTWSTLKYGGLNVSLVSGSITPRVKLISQCLLKFFLVWHAALVCGIKSLFRVSKPVGKGALVYGVPAADLEFNGNTYRFEEYCHHGNLKVLRNANHYFVQTVNETIKGYGNRFTYSRFPLFSLFVANKLSFSDFSIFLWRHCISAIDYFKLTLTCSASCLLWRDFAEDAVARSLDSRRLIETNLITNSNWLQQFLWMTALSNRSFPTVIALYSLNSSRLRFKGDRFHGGEHPGLRHLNVDSALIWLPSYEFELKRLGISCKAEAVGPILWYVQSKRKSIARRDEGIKVAVFDVTPKTPAALAKIGMIGSYYNLHTMKSFVDDILSVVGEKSLQMEKNIEILLKHKRHRAPSDDTRYLDHVDRQVSSVGWISLIEEDINLYDFISECHFVVVIPYSSPAFIASHVGVPAIYYDPSGELDGECPYIVDDDHIVFASGLRELSERFGEFCKAF